MSLKYNERDYYHKKLNQQENRADDLHLKIAVGGLGLAFYFVRPPSLEINCPELLQTIVVLYGITIILVLVSYWLATLAFSRQIDIIDEKEEKNPYAMLTSCINKFNMMLTLLAVTLSIIFFASSLTAL